MREHRRAGLLLPGLVLFAAGALGVVPGVAWSQAAEPGSIPSGLTESPAGERPAPEAPAAEVAEGEASGPLAARCRREVEELHAFFESWFNGTVPNDDPTFERFSGVLAEGFAIISPNGSLKEKAALIESLRPNHNPGGDQLIRIWIENFRLREEQGGLAIVTYEEWQERGGQRRGRVATAILREREGLPNGLEWVHVHETWLVR